jgi:hypothetical protein
MNDGQGNEREVQPGCCVGGEFHGRSEHGGAVDGPAEVLRGCVDSGR